MINDRGWGKSILFQLKLTRNALKCYPTRESVWGKNNNNNNDNDTSGGIMIKVSLCGCNYRLRSIVLLAYFSLLTLSISMVLPMSLPAAEPSTAAETSAAAGSISDVQKSQIAADVAAKKPFRLIMREARAAGISVQDTVAAMLSAGADPAAVVNAAGAEGYKTNEAVKAVLAIVKDKAAANTTDSAAGSKVLQSVISAAIAVGISQETISTIADQAGYKPSQIANAIVAAQNTSNAPVYGYSAPPPQSAPTFATGSPALALTGSAPAVSGGGGGAGAGGGGGPRVASPVRP